MRAIVAYITAAVAFGALDAIWLTQVGPRIYRPAIGDLLADQVRWAPAVIFYLLYMVGVTVFVTLPALSSGGLARAAGLGALFGLICYATYDLTNQATLRIWPTHLTLADMAWGAFATATASVASVYVTRMIIR